ncbi:obscurin-like protein 1a [Syngnathoides biaculeatus]|uniref:obscurin-like protein 1a n=1 Tax=Syngnathoides biaculeatus TaxID=300417 RepID=UPI002ADE6BED|nr:obscurin-like protein 1a [Syngnathoides biaculeatus]
MDIFGGAPRVLGYPRPVVVQCGADATLKCQIGGEPRPDVIWECKNVQIVTEGRYKLSEEGKFYLLSISGVSVMDAGQYICKARNSVGETYAAASLKVVEKDKQLENNGIKQHKTEHGHVNGVSNLENGDHSEENGAQDVDFTSDDRPRFLIKPLSLRVDRGQDAAFSCKVWGTPLPEVVWEKDGKKLNDIFESSHFSISVQDGGWFQLKVYRTRIPDKGVYTCKAMNRNGEALAGAVLLVDPVPERGDSTKSSHWSPKDRGGKLSLSKLREEPPASTTKVKKFVVAEGKHAKFRCFVTGKPKPEIIWKKDGSPLDPGRRHRIFEDREGYYTLKVLYCKIQDTGLYACVASNALGNTLSAVHLSVKGPHVRFKHPLKDVEAKERNVAVLECEVPNESVLTTWYREDERLMPSNKYGIEQQGTRRRLTIKDVEIDDDGVYFCEMQDGGKSIAELSVKGKILRKLPRKVEVLEGENATFFVEVEDDDMEIHWFKNGQKLHETHQTILKTFGNTHVLAFVNVVHQDSGVVTFVTGRSKTSSRLKVRDTRHCPPICPLGVKMDLDGPNGAVLSWVPAPNNQTTRSIFVVERQEVGSQEWQKCFTSEKATSTEISSDSVPYKADYRFRVCCINKYGRSGHVEFPKAVHLVPGTKICSPLQDLEVTEGEDAVFSIVLSASLVGTWFLNSAQLQDGGRYSVKQSKTQHTLVIHETFSAEDKAEITFIANGLRNSATLMVKPAVMKFNPLLEFDSTKRVQTGDIFVLYCEVSHPSAKVCWYKDGEELQMSDVLNIQSDGNMRRIVIQSAEKHHAGVYTCQTSGDVITFMVEVTGPPVEFIPGPEEDLHKNSMELDPVVLLCRVSREDAQVMWYKDGCQIEPSDNITLQTEGTLRRLIIRSVETSDAGSYTCQVENNTMEFSVNVKEPPVMIVDPKDDVIMERYISEDIHMQCELSRTGGKVQWFKNGEEVEEGGNIQLTREGPYRCLTILRSKVEDGGEYICETNGDSVFFQLIVTKPPVRIISPTDSELKITHLASTKLQLSCKISCSDAHVTWYKDSLEVEEGPNLILEVEGAERRLVIPMASIKDAGEFVCETEHDSVAFMVTIKEQPVVLSRLTNTSEKLQCLAGKNVVLEVKVSRLNAEVKWVLNDQEIEGSDFVTITKNELLRRLEMHSPSPADSGTYSCDAVDDKLDFEVTILEPPVNILKKSEIDTNLKILRSDDVVLECELSRGNAKSKWYKDGCRIECDGRFCEEEEGAFRSLVILNAELEDSGEYFLDAEDDNITFQVTVQEPPVTIVGNSKDADFQEMASGEELILACEVSHENAPVQWYCNDKVLVSDSRTNIESYGTLRKIIISNVQPSDSGKYICDAVDDKMISIVRIQVPRVVEFLTELQNTTVLEGEDATFKCVISPENVQMVWFMDNEVINPSDRVQITQNGLCHTLVIRKCRMLDCSKITAEAEGTTSKASLRVQEAQVMFTKKMEAVTAEEFADATLETEISLETGEVQWMRQGVVIQPGSRYSLNQNECKRSLTIHNLNLSDRGTYRCETLHDRTQVKLNVEPRKISIRKGLADQETLERETASFEVELSHPDVQGNWQKDGIRVKPNNQLRVSTNGRVHGLTLSNLTLEDTCTIAFSAEGVRTTARLTVKETPVTIIKALVDVRVEEEFPATLECELSRQNTEVRWFKSGTELKPGRNCRIYSMGRNKFCQILQCSLADSGIYTCDVGERTSSCSLDVYEHELKILQDLEDLHIQEDQNAVFMCEVSLKDAIGEWYKDGYKIRPTSTIKTRTEGTKHFLLMCNVKAEDAGEIRFVSRDTESTAYLEVEEPPVSIVKPLRDRTALEKHRVILECTVSSARCTATWYRGKERLVPSDRVDLVVDGCSHKLVIQEVELEDEGIYSIEVGLHSSKAKLMVEAQELVVVQELEDVEVDENEPAVFQCEVSVAISRTPVWTLNGENIKPGPSIRLENHGTVHKLTLKHTKVDLSGVVKFSVGKAKTSAILNVRECK